MSRRRSNDLCKPVGPADTTAKRLEVTGNSINLQLKLALQERTLEQRLLFHIYLVIWSLAEIPLLLRRLLSVSSSGPDEAHLHNREKSP